ncbi:MULTISPECIES: hypothetical protein [Mycobacterium ulcerans group]|uniref:DUF7373 family lipoprotein n=1 Tax=Mycobacterium ulcerans group TaxID=2993898 RepID=UPI000B2284C1|nr:MULTISPECIES: hypothetical protein [Mycobacterium ulcerans group]
MDVAQLDTGNYPTSPAPPLGVAGDAVKGGWAEARRIATAVVGPWETDPTLVHYAQFDSGVVKGPGAVDFRLGSPIGDALKGHNVIAGFSSARKTDTNPYKGLVNVVLELPNADEAVETVRAMADNSAALTFPFSAEPFPTEPFSIPRHPDTSAVTFHHDVPAPEPVGGERFSVVAFTAHGPFVLAQWADAAESADKSAQLIATALELQEPRIDTFTPTPPDRISDLPLDPSGLLSRVLPPEEENKTVDDGVYDHLGIVHFGGDPVRRQAMFKSAGLQQAAYTVTADVYEAGDAESAQRIVAELAAEAIDDGLVAATGVQGMPKARCLEGDLAYWCVAAADRYAYTVQGHEGAVHQMVAAQYRILTGK